MRAEGLGERRLALGRGAVAVCCGHIGRWMLCLFKAWVAVRVLRLIGWRVYPTLGHRVVCACCKHMACGSALRQGMTACSATCAVGAESHAGNRGGGQVQLCPRWVLHHPVPKVSALKH